MIDTHSHIFAEQFGDDIESVIDRAKKVGVSKILMPNIDLDSYPSLHTLAAQYKDYCLPMMGIHPTCIDSNWKNQLNSIHDLLNKDKYIAIGEIGIDLYWETTYEAEQIQAFKEQLSWSIDYKIPVSIHSRNAFNQVIKSIKQIGDNNLSGIFHSFTGDDNDLKTIHQFDNFMIGINGIVTFKNSALPVVLKKTDLSRIVLETDAPYLAPAQYRGKRNEPSYLCPIVDKLAEIYNTTPDHVMEVTTQNAIKIFNLQ